MKGNSFVVCYPILMLTIVIRIITAIRPISLCSMIYVKEKVWMELQWFVPMCKKLCQSCNVGKTQPEEIFVVCCSILTIVIRIGRVGVCMVVSCIQVRGDHQPHRENFSASTDWNRNQRSCVLRSFTRQLQVQLLFSDRPAQLDGKRQQPHPKFYTVS